MSETESPSHVDRTVTTRIRRIAALVALMAVTTQLIGCGASYVGRWKSDQFHPANPELKGPGSLEVDIRDDQTFTALYESKDKTVKRGGTGQWDRESDQAIRLFVKGGDGPEMTNAQLEGSNTLLIIGKGFAEKLKRD